jgi:hypothetical protein
MPETDVSMNCGIYMIDGVSEFKDTSPRSRYNFLLDLQDVGEGHVWTWPGAFLFTDAKAPQQNTRTAGDAFADFIRRHKLGKLQATGWFKNPNTNNLIQQWTFFPDGKALEDHIDKLAKRLGDEE